MVASVIMLKVIMERGCRSRGGHDPVPLATPQPSCLQRKNVVSQQGTAMGTKEQEQIPVMVVLFRS